MKNTIYLMLLCAVVSFVSCQKDNVDIQPEEEIERSSERRKKKVQVCHCRYGRRGGQWKIISINKKALSAHLRHGDFKMKDKDRDGFYKKNPCVPADEVDCDDRDANVNPGVSEVIYNGVDDDCDPNTPDDDLDGDGFALVDDCDDSDPTVTGPCQSCPAVDLLDLDEITPAFAGFEDETYFILTLNSSGTQAILAIELDEATGQFTYFGSYYLNDNLVFLSELDRDSGIVVDSTIDGIQECQVFLDALVASAAS